MGYEHALTELNNSVVPHFSELDFVFGLPLLSESNIIKSKGTVSKTTGTTYLFNYTNEEKQFSLLMIDYWTSFAKYGYVNNINFKILKINNSYINRDPNHVSLDNSFLRKTNWPKFSADNPSVFILKAEKQVDNKKMFDEWEAKHRFWYETLPNLIYNKCKMERSRSISKNKSLTIFRLEYWKFIISMLASLLFVSLV